MKKLYLCSLFVLVLFLKMDGQTRFFAVSGFNFMLPYGEPSGKIVYSYYSGFPIESYQTAQKPTPKMGFQLAFRIEKPLFPNFFLATEIGLAYQQGVKTTHSVLWQNNPDSPTDTLNLHFKQNTQRIRGLFYTIPVCFKFHLTQKSKFWLEPGIFLQAVARNATTADGKFISFYRYSGATPAFTKFTIPVESFYQNAPVQLNPIIGFTFGIGRKIRDDFSIFLRFKKGFQRESDLPKNMDALDFSCHYFLFQKRKKHRSDFQKSTF